MEKRLMTVPELATYLAMKVPTVYAYVARNKFPPECVRRIGRSVKFDRQAIDEWISGQGAAAQASVQARTQSAR